MSAAARDPKRLQSLLSVAASHLELGFRPMFGGVMGYVGGRPFASLSDRGIAFKFTGAAHAEALAEPGAEALRYEPDQPPSKRYVLVPEAALADPGHLRAWADRSAVALAQAAPKPVRKRTKIW